MLEIGIKGSHAHTVTYSETAAALGSGLLEVFSTPYMIAFMEYTAQKSVEPYLETGYSTVGTLVNIRHLAATPVGMHILFTSELIEIDRKRLLFSVSAYDEVECIGMGTHERFIIENEKFLEKTSQKKKKPDQSTTGGLSDL